MKIFSSVPLHFGWNAAIDVGSSNGATSKVVIYDDHWKKLNGMDSAQTLQDLKTNDDVLKSLARLIATLYSAVKNLLKSKEQLGNTFVFLMPGQPYGNLIPYPSGLETSSGKPLVNLNLNDIPKFLEQEQKLELQKDIRLITLNDVAGGLTKAISQLSKQHPEHFQPGMELLYLMSGGGLGVACASYTDDGKNRGLVRLELTEMADMPYPYPWKSSYLLGGINANVFKLLEDFTDALPSHLEKAKQNILQSRNGKVVTAYKEAQRLVPDMTYAEYKQASKMAVDNYINALAYLAVLRVYSGTNLVVVSGQIAKGVKDFVEKHSDLFDKDIQNYERIPGHHNSHNTFEKAFLSRVWHQLSPIGRSQFEIRKFNVITDIDINDNTEGAPFIAQGWFANRGDRYIIPADTFKVAL